MFSVVTNKALFVQDFNGQETDVNKEQKDGFFFGDFLAGAQANKEEQSGNYKKKPGDGKG